MSVWVIKKLSEDRHTSDEYVEMSVGDYWPYRSVPAIFTTFDKAVEFIKEKEFEFKPTKFRGVDGNKVTFYNKDFGNTVYEIIKVEPDAKERECYLTKVALASYYQRTQSWDETFEEVLKDILKLKRMEEKYFVRSGEVYKWRDSMEIALKDCRIESSFNFFKDWLDKFISKIYGNKEKNQDEESIF